jgi:hypothetical protein
MDKFNMFIGQYLAFYLREFISPFIYALALAEKRPEIEYAIQLKSVDLLREVLLLAFFHQERFHQACVAAGTLEPVHDSLPRRIVRD